ncbi:MAG: glutamate racemase [Candidatus Marinimicrobia bacterium]|jgi:glutamate racemase|nr:glutamate racemase [Candidatus Neomarinimicrobiota bacterium]MBT3675472.1 glutamate racemase [Candidatus Neomarinimicrobiota bacterium]MBT3762584.1 glutamate racemase [Candidatus Neomarinimicrobiota bacterium]MBT4067723.1 glutamate racemase [Candidatus Neomarinimicrobiota bacterium]MBT4271617.1 glutamate racemase [Candidatus Neomarinimicrobiota bacterium]
MSPGPIAVFDSGLGGLTVVKALQQKLPNESIIYFGDTARVPYGNKSQTLIKEYSEEITKFLIGKKAKMVIVACNTASALALSHLKQTFDIPILGVIEPGAEAARAVTKSKNIGIIGTLATIRSEAYEKAIQKLDASIGTTAKACPLFVPLVEEGWLKGGVPTKIAETYLDELVAEGIDTLILGCTHYPLLIPVLEKVVGDNIQIVDSAETTARYAVQWLNDLGLLDNDSSVGLLENYVTDLPVRFKRVAHQFLGREIDHVSSVHIG